MKELILLRHAKSSWDSLQLDDKYRPLNDRGRLQISQVAAFMIRQGIHTDCVLVSSATRTIMTCDYLLNELAWSKNIHIDNRLYLADDNRCEQIVKEYSDSFERILLIAHNNGIEKFASRLLSRTIHMKTCHCLHFAVHKFNFQLLNEFIPEK